MRLCPLSYFCGGRGLVAGQNAKATLMKKQKRKSTLMLTMLTFSLILTICSCAEIKLYPIDGEHIINVAEGEEFTVPRNGYFLSDEYFKKILKANVGKGF